MLHIIIIAVCFVIVAYSHTFTENPHNTLEQVAEALLKDEGIEDIDKCFHLPKGCKQ